MLTLLLVGCNTEEKPIYLDCHRYDRTIPSNFDEILSTVPLTYKSIIIIDKQNGLFAELLNYPEFPAWYVWQLYADDKYYGIYDGAQAVPMIDRFTLEAKGFGSAGVMYRSDKKNGSDQKYYWSCNISESPYPEFRAEVIEAHKDQTTPKI